MPPNSTHEEIIDAAILRKRGGDFAGAHTLFAQACTEERQNPRLLHEFAQTKKQLAKQENPNHQRGLDTRRRLAAEAADLLRSAIQLANSDTRAAWCWFDLAEVLQWLRRPLSEVESAYLRAIELLPEETRFTQAYRKWKDSSNWD